MGRMPDKIQTNRKKALGTKKKRKKSGWRRGGSGVSALASFCFFFARRRAFWLSHTLLSFARAPTPFLALCARPAAHDSQLGPTSRARTPFSFPPPHISRSFPSFFLLPPTQGHPTCFGRKKGRHNTLA
ncbi:hypothetical protein TW95_gp1328 [Pandoravirus inopinatum]|uniref:Uncharacterized protein n=1 Tax=Pandoravirus inopinatum TaxID=1605721 RepID=A0A0B5JE66_9VIRU|nr:hypothetical protein TW95_gp1328 [Pandoravirus inopinatum]AJF98062.1 hypothetical protein [Pandoravirus inopinatum]